MVGMYRCGSGCCKEVYRFPNTLLIPTPLVQFLNGFLSL